MIESKKEPAYKNIYLTIGAQMRFSTIYAISNLASYKNKTIKNIIEEAIQDLINKYENDRANNVSLINVRILEAEDHTILKTYNIDPKIALALKQLARKHDQTIQNKFLEAVHDLLSKYKNKEE